MWAHACVYVQASVFAESLFGALKGIDGKLNGVFGWKEIFQSPDHEMGGGMVPTNKNE